MQLKVWTLGRTELASGLYRSDAVGAHVRILLMAMYERLAHVLERPYALPTEKAICLDIGIDLTGRDLWGPGWQFSTDLGEGVETARLVNVAMEDLELRVRGEVE